MYIIRMSNLIRKNKKNGTQKKKINELPIVRDFREFCK